VDSSERGRTSLVATKVRGGRTERRRRLAASRLVVQKHGGVADEVVGASRHSGASWPAACAHAHRGTARCGAWPAGVVARPRLVPGRGTQGLERAEGPRCRAGPRRCFHSLRTPALGRLDAWQDMCRCAYALWCGVVVARVVFSNYLRNFKNA
jgi:hypothetical protein